MLRKLAIFASISLTCIGSASATTLFIPGASGVSDKAHEQSLPSKQNGCIVDVPAGRMIIAPYAAALPPPHNNDCLASYPVNLPAGSTIDGVEIAYRDDSGASGRSITTYLAVNRLKPYMGPVAVAGANDFNVPSLQQLYMNMGALSVPMVNGDIFWVQVSTHRITEVDYVAVTYH